MSPESVGGGGEAQSRQRYQVIKKIDAGGMAEIYLGRSESIEGIARTVAIKRVLPHLTKNEKFINMFLDEARLSMLLTHANIVQVFDVGKSGDTYFIVMEYVEGYNLRRVFQKASELGYRIPLEIACYILMEVAEGLAHAHEKTDPDNNHLHIVHRDLSPPNIMVSRAGETKITDFGLAKAMTQLEITDPGVVKGKFSYLAPETAEGKEIDHRCDVFASGIVLWEILANRRLFLGKTDLDTVELVKAAQVPPLGKFNAQVTPEFERVVARALARNPKERYTSAREFGDALASYVFKHKLRVTKADVAEMVRQLFSDNGAEGMESPEERIATLIQEEILNLSMLGYSSPGDTIDGSRPLDPSRVKSGKPPKFDLSPYWSTGGGVVRTVEQQRMSEAAGKGKKSFEAGALTEPPRSRQGMVFLIVGLLVVVTGLVLYFVLGHQG